MSNWESKLHADLPGLITNFFLHSHLFFSIPLQSSSPSPPLHCILKSFILAFLYDDTPNWLLNEEFENTVIEDLGVFIEDIGSEIDRWVGVKSSSRVESVTAVACMYVDYMYMYVCVHVCVDVCVYVCVYARSFRTKLLGAWISLIVFFINITTISLLYFTYLVTIVWVHCCEVPYFHSYFYCRVLIFPPVTDHYRFLIHKAVRESREDLHSFSIGAGDDRRTVVCRPLLLVRWVTWEVVRAILFSHSILHATRFE